MVEEKLTKKQKVAAKIKALELKLKQKQGVVASNKVIIRDYMESHRWEYYSPFKWQAKIADALRGKYIILAPSPNGIGKTAHMSNLLCSFMEGYEAWSEVDEMFPGAVKVKGKWYKPSALGKKPPVRIRLTGEDWDHHLGQTVINELKTWFPRENYDTKRNTSGVEYFWTHKGNGSTLEMMTHKQDLRLFEGWRGDVWAADEPPPFDVFTAMMRGLAERKGKTIFFTTPLSQAWMLDELILSNRRDVAVAKDLLLYDNEISYKNDNAVLERLGIGGKVTKYWREADGAKKEFFDLILYKDDKGAAAEKYVIDTAINKENLDSELLELIFLKKAKDTSLEQKPSRFFGMFKRLMGLVIKNFDNEKHIVPAPEEGIPTDWIVTPFIDLHLSKPHALSFYGCDKYNRHYAIDEYWINCSPEELADIIIRKKRIDGWNISNAYIDDLSKGDNYMKNRVQVEDSFTIISERLSEEDIYLQGARKDKESGFRNIRTWLEGPNKIPILFFFDTLQSNGSNVHNGVLYEIQRLCFDDKGKVEKVDDDFMENLYRYTLAAPEYTDNSDVGGYLVGAGSSSEGWLGT